MSSALRLCVIVVALLATAALGIIAYNMNAPRAAAAIAPEKGPAPVATATAGYFVAARPLTRGTLLRAEDFTVRSIPAAKVPAGAIRDTPDFKASLPGSLVRTFIEAGNPVTLQDILRPSDRGFLASVLAPGSRAISINVDSESGISGLVRPGDLVDVVLTQVSGKTGSVRDAVSETVLQKVPVIAIDQEIAQGGAIDQKTAQDNKASAKRVQTVSLELTPEQVKKIEVAKQLGKLSLAVRAANDRDKAVDAGAVSGCDVSSAFARRSSRQAMVTIYTSSRKQNAINQYSVLKQDTDNGATDAGCGESLVQAAAPSGDADQSAEAR
jgi:pilus assembly protein CpaB